MNLHGARAVREAQRLGMIAHERHSEEERYTEGICAHESEPPTLAGYIVYGVTVVGFLVMCVLAALQ